jgi:lipoyl(octanoyl) transferase
MLVPAPPLVVRRLGRLSYAQGLELQAQLVADRQAERIVDVLLLLEHDPVFTLGRNAREQNLLVRESLLRARGFDVFETGRGGDVTYHGPGQVVGYPIISLAPDRQDVHRYVRDLEEVMIRSCRDFGVEAERVAGFAFNVANDLAPYSLIVPCGIPDRGVTTLQQLLGRPVPLAEAHEALTRHFVEVFERSC